MSEEIVYLADITVYNAGVSVLHYATVGGVYGGIYYEERLKQPGNFTVDMFSPGTTAGASKIGHGEVVLLNADGGLDYLLDYGFDGRDIVFKKALLVAGAFVITILQSCSQEQAVFTKDEISIRIKDPQLKLNVPIQPTKYAGSNSLPAGVEGTNDIKGKPKPLTFGKVFNITPVLCNTSRLIYQVHTKAAAIPAVYDKGVLLTAGAAYTTAADMQANDPAPGTYRVLSISTGAYFRLGSSPAGQITADAVSGAALANRNAAIIAYTLITKIDIGVTVNVDEVNALSALNPAEIGLYISEERTVLSALDEVLGSIGAWGGFDIDGVYRMGLLTAPSGTADVELTDAEYLSLERVASSDEGRGIPPWRVNLNYAKNHTVQTAGELAGLVSVSTPWAEVILPVSSVWRKNAIAFGNGALIAFEDQNGYFIRSTDGGYTWTRYQLANVDNISCATFGNGIFVAGTADGTVTLTSSDGGLTWSRHVINIPFNFLHITSGNGIFVASVDNIGALTNTRALTSTDGIAWVERTIIAGVTDQWHLTFGNGIFVAACSGQDVDKSATSVDGITWAPYALALNSPAIGIAFSNGIFQTLCTVDDTRQSFNGATWVSGSVDGTVLFSGIIPIDRGFLAIGTGTAFFSDTGKSWTQKKLPDVCKFENVFAAIQTQNTVILLDNNSNRALLLPTSVLYTRAFWLSKEYRTVTVSDATVLTAHPLAPEMNVNTLLVDPTAAQTEADRLLTLYKVRRDTIKVEVPSQVLQYIQIGKVVKITSPRYGYSAGKLFRVLGTAVDWQSGVTTLTLWG